MAASITDRLRQASPSMTTCQEAADIIEHAYGLLWRDTSFQGPATHAARKLLLSAIDKGGQSRGIQNANNIYGPVTDHEALKNFP